MQYFHGIEFEIFGELKRVDLSEVEAVEQRLNCRFPSDYRDFITRFGVGEFNEVPIALIAPASIEKDTSSEQDGLARFWPWGSEPQIIDQSFASETIACFSGWQGDQMRFHPSNPSRIFLLPKSGWFPIAETDSLAGLFDLFKGIGYEFTRLTLSP